MHQSYAANRPVWSAIPFRIPPCRSPPRHPVKLAAPSRISSPPAPVRLPRISPHRTSLPAGKAPPDSTEAPQPLHLPMALRPFRPTLATNNPASPPAWSLPREFRNETRTSPRHRAASAFPLHSRENADRSRPQSPASACARPESISDTPASAAPASLEIPSSSGTPASPLLVNPLPASPRISPAPSHQFRSERASPRLKFPPLAPTSP